MRCTGWIVVALLAGLSIGLLSPVQASKAKGRKRPKSKSGVTVVTGKVLLGKERQPLVNGTVSLGRLNASSVQASTDARGNFRVALRSGIYTAQVTVGNRRYYGVGRIRVHGRRQRITLHFTKWVESEPPAPKQPASNGERGQHVSLSFSFTLNS